MLKEGIAQIQFTKLLNQTVIMPYKSDYRLIKNLTTKKELDNGIFNQFLGILDKKFKIDDEKYNTIYLC